MVWMLLMFIILVIMFDNIFYPFAILSSIFLSIGWSIIILAVLRFSFNFPAQLWIFWVLWVWVNQAIIHIEDFMIFFDKEKMNALDSFRKSIALRFVPIVLTKITTITWLIILALKDEIYWSLAIAFIW
jgi:multidrug efflux pump subunit AcrB